LSTPRISFASTRTAKPLEFEKGKAGIVVPSKDKLPAVIDTLITAVRAGELDELFSQAAKTGGGLSYMHSGMYGMYALHESAR
jgi:hypothetical protein